MSIKRFSAILGIVTALVLSSGSLPAQQDNGGRPGGPGGGPGGNFDPSEFRQRMMDQIRKNLEFTNDDEWAVVQPLIEKVMEARRETFTGGGMGMGGPGGPPPGGGQQGPGGGRGFGPQPSAERQALQKAIDDKAPSAELKDVLARFRASLAEKQARLVAAQANLKAVLTVKQEALAVLMGLLQ